MDQESISIEYARLRPLLEQLRTEAVFAIEKALSSESIKIHSETSRIKELNSLLRKVETKGTAEPFRDIHDLVGIRIVCLFLSDIPKIEKVVRTVFAVVLEDNKLDNADVSSFGYFSVHFDTKLKQSYAGPRYDEIVNALFEIQVRTIALDAWANVSHHLSYRNEIDVPSELKKDFFGLSGLFYIADKHFEMFYAARLQSRKETNATFAKSKASVIRKQELNIDTLAALLRAKYPDRHHATDRTLSELLDGLIRLNFCDVGAVSDVIDATKTAFAEFEKAGGPAGRYYDSAALQISLYIYNKRFLDRAYADQPDIRRLQNDMLAPFRKFVKRKRQTQGG